MLDIDQEEFWPDSRAGALSCLTGIAARKSVELKKPIRISELVSLPPKVG